MDELLAETKEGFLKRTKKSILTFAAFVIFVGLLPFFLVLHIAVTVCRYLWLRAFRRPHLEIVGKTTVRTAMDTHRNQAIIPILLQVKGKCDVELVKERIKETIIERKKQDGSLRFPHMKMKLISYYGRYAWLKNMDAFNLDNHIIHDNKPTLRNRAVTSSNIQEYISEIMFKYIPLSNPYPPWELRIITTEPDRFYILARLHHLYTSEDGISFGDLVMIKADDSWKPVDSSSSGKEDEDNVENILASIVQRPKAIPIIYQRLSDFFGNLSRELISVYDPQENPTILTSQYTTIFDCAVILLITLYFTIKEIPTKTAGTLTNNNNFSTIFRREASKRHLSIAFVLKALLHTFYPHVVIRFVVVRCLRLIIVNCLLNIPALLVQTLHNVPRYFEINLLIIQAIIEIFRLFSLLYQTPKVIVDEIVLPIFSTPKHHLQRASVSGRKIVSWTEPISMDVIKTIKRNTRTASCEIELYAVAASLHEYFQKIQLPEPDSILTTVRFVAEEEVMKSSDQIASGFLCLPLPMKVPSDDPLYGLHMVQLALQDALTKQTALYLASLWQYDYSVLTTILPSFIVRLILYVLSKRYPIMMTQIETHNKQLQRKQKLIWGQEVEAFFYWRPPQANNAMSVSLISYGDELRFTLMTDAKFAPDHNIIVSEYPTKLAELTKESADYRPAKYVVLPDTWSVHLAKKNKTGF